MTWLSWVCNWRLGTWRWMVLLDTMLFLSVESVSPWQAQVGQVFEVGSMPGLQETTAPGDFKLPFISFHCMASH